MRMHEEKRFVALFTAMSLGCAAAFADMIAERTGGPVTFHKTTAGSECIYCFPEPGTYSRDVTVVPPPKGPMWYAFESRARPKDGGDPVVNEGRIIMPRTSGGSCGRISDADILG